MKRNSAFTLLELMVVLAIIGILAALALQTTIGNRPKIRLTAASSEIRLTLLKARTQAVRTTRNVKVCIFKDPTPVGATGADNGIVRVLSCNTPGRAGCFGGPICADVAANGTPWSVTVDTGITCPGATANRWCEEPALSLNLGETSRAKENVNISRLLNTANTDTGRNSFEITYIASGAVDPERSSASSGRIQLINRDMCVGACAALANYNGPSPYVEFSVGGSSRISN